MATSWKHRIRDLGVVRPLWGTFRRTQLLREYAERREHYARIAAERGLVYRENEIPALLKQRMARRGYTPRPKPKGEIRTLAFIPQENWHEALLPDLRELGPVELFDYRAHGFRINELHDTPRLDPNRRRALNELFFQKAKEVGPVDWAFIYGNGSEVERDTLRRITEELGFPLVTMCLDDKQSWAGGVVGGQHVGQVDIAPHFDLCWTSARVACEWYLAEGAIPVYMPEGFDASTFHPMDVPKDIDVSFIGARYGFRPAVVDFLREHGIEPTLFGAGWGTPPLPAGGQVGIFNRSAINLGMGGVGYSEELTNVKGRDFEVPGTGGGMYLTSFNPDLALHFEVGREIVCYRTRDEMLELIRYYLKRRDEAAAIAAAGHRRSMAEHRWLHRYERVLHLLGVLRS